MEARKSLIAGMLSITALVAACGSSSSSASPIGGAASSSSSGSGSTGSGSPSTATSSASSAAASGATVSTAYLTLHLTGGWMEGAASSNADLNLTDSSSAGTNIKIISSKGITTDQLTAFVSQVQQVLKKSFPDATFTAESGDVVGTAAQGFRWQGTANGANVQGEDVFLVHGDSAYTFALASRPDDFNRETGEFASMLNSISWK